MNFSPLRAAQKVRIVICRISSADFEKSSSVLRSPFALKLTSFKGMKLHQVVNWAVNVEANTTQKHLVVSVFLNLLNSASLFPASLIT